MPQKLDETYEPKPFMCKGCGWTLGESYRDIGKRVTQLRVYRVARPSEIGADLRQMAFAAKYSITHGNDCGVMCEHCGAETGWYANQTAIEEMLERKSKRIQEVLNG